MSLVRRKDPGLTLKRALHQPARIIMLAMAVSRPELKVPLDIANSYLAERIEMGCQLVAAEPRSGTNLTSSTRVDLWRDANGTWLDNNLGGAAAEEYRSSSVHFHGPARGSSPERGFRFLRNAVMDETSELDSIKERLPPPAEDVKFHRRHPGTQE